MSDAHLVITPTGRGQDLYAAIALPATASTAEARRAARDMRRSATGDRLQEACVAEVVLGDAQHRQVYDDLRTRAAAAGVPLPGIGIAMPGVPLPPPPRVRARRWILDNGPKFLDTVGNAATITGRGVIAILKLTLVVALIIIAIIALAKLGAPGRHRERYEIPKIPEYRYRYTPPPIDFEYTVPDYKLPKLDVPIYTPPPK